MTTTSFFQRDLLRFLRDLQRNNDRGWFAANRARFERSVQQPMLDFIEAMKPRLRKISRHMVADARKSGGSMFRIYRDTRFSKDKRPYKEHVAAQFRHEAGKDVHAPGFYLHVSPTEVMLGAGIWRPDSGSLTRIRRRIAARPGEWRKVRDDARARSLLTIGGESLKRPPAGFAADHAEIEDLKRKDFILFRNGKPTEALAPDFVERVTEAYAASGPWMRFLCKALDLPF